MSPAAPGTGREGVQKLAVAADEADQRLDRWFRRRFPDIGQGRIEKMLRKGEIRLDGARAKASDRVAEGQIVRVPPLGPAADGAERAEPAAAEPVSAQEAAFARSLVLYRDDAVIALNKPPGLAVQGGSGQTRHVDRLLTALSYDRAEPPRLIHRLDKDTSGVLLLGRSARAAAALGKAFRGRAADKIYWAAVAGAPKPRHGRIRYGLVKAPGGQGAGERMLCVAPEAVASTEGAKTALTEFATIEALGVRAAWLALRPVTGRTHQLRAHLAEIGAPVVGDGKYGANTTEVRGANGRPGAQLGGEISRKLHLHARRLALPHPLSGARLVITAPLPEHMARTWEALGWSGDAAADDPFADLDAD